MKNEYDYRIILTDEQQTILETAINLLEPFDKENISYGGYFFEDVDEDGNHIADLELMDYDTCNNFECSEKALHEIEKEYPTHNIRRWSWDNDGDHENIETCSQCDRPLNGSLTWIKYEFEHHQEYSTNYLSMTDSRNAFDIRVMLQSFPSNDHSVGMYAIHQESLGNPGPIKTALKYQSDFTNEVIEFAKLVIDTITNYKIEIK